MKQGFLSSNVVQENINILQAFMKKKKIDGFYISSFDPYLNEYVPLVNCHRYYFTGFSGSTAEAFIPQKGKVKLYVDGRYHEQADKEVDKKQVDVVKCGLGVGDSVVERLFLDIKNLKVKNLGIEGDRTSLKFYQEFLKICKVTSFIKNELADFINFLPLDSQKEVYFIEKEFRGADTKEKLKQIGLKPKEGIFATSLDSIAWITNCRGYHLPFQSAFMAKALVTSDKVHVFLDKLCPLNKSVKKNKHVIFYNIVGSDLEKYLKKIKLTLVKYSPGALNTADFSILKKIYNEKNLQVFDGLFKFHSIKSNEEMIEITKSFNRSNQAIANTIRFVREELNRGKRINEVEFYNAANDFYKDQGAVEQSFNTISAIGSNSSIIHFGSPSEFIKANYNDLMLLDTGAYYEGGFATDTTRTFLANPEKAYPSLKQKEIYTLVLKGLINAMTAVVPEGTLGIVIDGLARNPLLKAGYNYAHGTGHGVGINVHEPGINFSVRSMATIKIGQLVSIEPGIYLPGFGGVRLENIVLVEKHPEFNGMVRFKNMVFVGFDWSLIEESMLNEDEKDYLIKYEEECRLRGTNIS